MDKNDMEQAVVDVCQALRERSPPVLLLPRGNDNTLGEQELEMSLDEQVATFTEFMGLYRIQAAMDVIRPRLIKGENPWSTSYGYKHSVEEHTGYICNGIFIIAAYLLGFEPNFAVDESNRMDVNASYPGFAWCPFPDDLHKKFKGEIDDYQLSLLRSRCEDCGCFWILEGHDYCVPPRDLCFLSKDVAISLDDKLDLYEMDPEGQVESIVKLISHKNTVYRQRLG